MKSMLRPYYKNKTASTQDPKPKINQHHRVGIQLKKKYPHLPMLQAQHFNRVLSI